VPEGVVRKQVNDLEEGLTRLAAEGFSPVHVLFSPEEVESVIVERM
jgi:protein involved in sex pheromone biosynthesis